MAETCNIRFCDNQKIESANYTVTNEDASFLFSNAIDTVRSKIFKATNNNDWRLVVDLGFPDTVNSLHIFGPLGDALGITREATIRIEADNVNAWTSPDFSETITISNDNQIVHFLATLNLTYRFWSVYIDDPTNPDFINFGYIYLGDYTNPEFRTITRGFKWTHVDETTVQKSLNGTPYFNELTRYDFFSGLNLGFVLNADRSLLEELYQRVGKFTPMPISIDPETKTASDINKLTRFARFATSLEMTHQVFEYFEMSFDLEEVI